MKSTDDAQPAVDNAFAAETRTMHHAPAMKTFETRCETHTRAVPDFVDVTDDIDEAIASSGVTHGRAILFAPEGGCSIMVNEHESGLLDDLKKTLARLKAANGRGSRALLGSASVVLPIEEGRLRLGTWQRVLLVELAEPSPRSLDVEIIGER